MFFEKVIYGVYSLPFPLPYSPKNIRLFGAIHSLQARVRQVEHKVTVYDSGVPVIPKAVLLIRRSTMNTFSARIRDGILEDKDLFGESITKLDYGDPLDMDPLGGVGGTVTRIDNMSAPWRELLAKWPVYPYFIFPFKNPGFHGGHDNFIGEIGNDYYLEQSSPLEFRLKSDGQDRVGQNTDSIHWVAPAIYIMTILEAIAKRIDVVLSGNVLGHEEFLQLGVFISKSWCYMSDVGAGEHSNIPYRYLNIANYVPDWPISKLLQELKQLFGMNFSINPIRGELKIDLLVYSLIDQSFVDFTDRASAKYKILERKTEGVSLSYHVNEDDAVLSSGIKNLIGKDIVDPVLMVSDLLATGLRLDMAALILTVNQYYHVTYVSGVLTWVFYCFGWEPLVIGDGADKVLSEFTIPPLIRDETRQDLMPDMDSVGSANGFDVGENTVLPILLFYRGLADQVAGIKHPWASFGPYDYDGVRAGRYNSLQMDGEYGIKEQFVGSWQTLKAGFRPTEFEIDIKREEIYGLDLAAKFKVGNAQFFCEEFEVELPLTKPAKFKLQQISTEFSITPEVVRTFKYLLQTTATGSVSCIFSATDKCDIHWGDQLSTVYTNQSGSVNFDYIAEVGTKIIAIRAYKNEDITEIQCQSNSLIGDVPTLTDFENIGNCLLNNNGLTGWQGGEMPTSIIDFRAANNALTVTAVNGILEAFERNLSERDAIGWLYLNGGTNAIPTGAGLTAKANIQAHGWTVQTN